MSLHIPRSVSSRPCRVVLALLLSFVCIALRLTLAQSGATLEVTPSGSAPAGSTVTVKWSGPNGPGDYITVVRRGARPADYLNYQQTGGRTPVNPVSIVLPAEPGAYEIRYVLAGGVRDVLASVPYEVVAVVATIAGPVSVAPGASFELSWSGPNNGGDWVTIVAVGAAPRAYGSYVDARNGRADTRTGNRVATLRAPAQPGRYELRYVQQGSRVIGTRVIEVAVGAAAAGAAGGGAAAGATGGAAGAADIRTAGGGAAAAGATDSKTAAGAAAAGAAAGGAAGGADIKTASGGAAQAVTADSKIAAGAAAAGVAVAGATGGADIRTGAAGAAAAGATDSKTAAAAAAAGTAAGAAAVGATGGGGAAAAGTTDSKTLATQTPTGVVNSLSTQTPRAGQTAIIGQPLPDGAGRLAGATDPATTCGALSDIVAMWDRLVTEITAFYAKRLSATTSADERMQLEKERTQALATASSAKSKSIALISKLLEQAKCVPEDALVDVVDAISAMSKALEMTGPAAAPAAAGR